jgi:site-specific DNA-methyltransferase (adenine-specific)
MPQQESSQKIVNASQIVPLPSGYSEFKCVFNHDDSGVSLYHTNCIEFMDALYKQHPDGLFDMIFADPPYFLSNGGITCHGGKMVKVHKGDWDKSQGPVLNHEFNLDWISRCQKLLKPNGTLWVSGTQHVIYSVGFGMQQLGMRLLNNITWEKPNPPPNLSCRFFTHATETLLWAAKSEKSRHCFNYDEMREMNSGKQMKSLWKVGIPTKEEKHFGKHPTQKPVALMERIILSCTNEGDMVFDPFAGSATTGVAATKLDRKFIGCELDTDAVSISIKRLTKAVDDTAPNSAGKKR